MNPAPVFCLYAQRSFKGPSKEKFTATFKTAHDDDELISAYLADIARIPLITREQEVELAQKAHDGDVSAKQRLVNANLRFVVKVAKEYTNRGLDFLELINEGNIALLEAVDSFDETKGYRFITYAVRRIKQDISRALCEKSHAIHLPANKAAELSQITKARSYIRSGNKGSALSEEEVVSKIATMRGLEENQIRSLESVSRTIFSLDAPVDTDDHAATLGDFVEDSTYSLPENDLFNKSMKRDLYKAISMLPERERTVLRLHSGLNNTAPLSLEAIGARIHVTKERVRQIENNAKRMLRLPKFAELLKAWAA